MLSIKIVLFFEVQLVGDLPESKQERYLLIARAQKVRLILFFRQLSLKYLVLKVMRKCLVCITP